MWLRTLLITISLVGLSAWALYAKYQASEPIVIRDVAFASPGGQKLKLDFVRPHGSGPFSLVVLVHSGNWSGGSRSEFKVHQRLLAKSGFASAAVDFRLAPTFHFPAQVDDIVDAIKFLVHAHQKYRIDPDRVALLGVSSGGHLALMAGLRPSDRYQVKTVVNLGGPTDLTCLAEEANPAVKVLLGTDNVQSEEARQASPLSAIHRNAPSVLTVQGTADPLVPMAEQERFQAELKNAGNTGKLLKIAGGGHLVQDGPNWPQTQSAIVDHLVESLQQTPNEVGDPIRQAPRIQRVMDTNVGQVVPDLAFSDLHEMPGKISDFQNDKYLVIALTDIGCPLCLKYVPSLERLESEYRDRGVRFLFVYPNAADNSDTIRKVSESRHWVGRSVHDKTEAFVQALQAKSTTEVFVLDPQRTIVYRGAIDDQYGFGYSLEQPRHRFLAAALDQLLQGQQPTDAATTAPGCDIASADSETPRELNYHGRIERIIQQHCGECHRDGGVAPFALDTYEKVVARREVIRRVVAGKIMPPWFAAKPASGHHSPWANDRSLSAEAESDVLTWLSGDLKAGDPNDAPRPVVYSNEWSIGQPDEVFQLPAPFNVKAEGTMPYLGADVQLNFKEDRWVQAVEVRPTNAAVLHHCLVFARMPNEKDPDEVGSFLAIYVPGNSTQVYPPGFAKKIPKGAKLHFQMHYTPNGTATQDQTRIGIIYAKQPPKHEVKVEAIVNPKFTIPPNESDYRIEATTPKLPAGTRILAFMPHMHLRGKAARYELVQSSGEREIVLDVPRYDFNWQLFYRFAEPMKIPEGGRIRYVAWYDNSSLNPANPNPNAAVHWGLQTFDEMHLGYVELYRE